MAENDAKKVTPMLVIDRVTFKKLKVDVRSATYAKLAQYVAFYQKSSESGKATESELVDAALEWVFTADTAFKNFMSNGGPVKRTAAAVGEGKRGGVEDLSQPS